MVAERDRVEKTGIDLVSEGKTKKQNPLIIGGRWEGGGRWGKKEKSLIQGGVKGRTQIN